jgi:hypothetical protein
MRSALVILMAGAGVFLTQGQPAVAQYVNPYGNMGRSYQQAPYQSPTVSPWLNLVGGGSIAPYQLRVLPEFQRENFQNAVLGAWPGLQGIPGGASQPQQPLDLDIPTLPQTGHLSAFSATGGYYNYPTQQRPFYPLNPNQARMLPR